MRVVDGKVIERWHPEKRAEMHKVLDLMMDRGDRVLFVSIGREEGDTIQIREHKVAEFYVTTTLELIGALERVKQQLIAELDAGVS